MLPVRRNSPELILPDAGTGTGMTPGIASANAAADTNSAYAEICSTTEFGTLPLVLVGVFSWHRALATATANGFALFQRLTKVELATGAAASEVNIQELIFANSASISVSGNTDGVTSVEAGATGSFFKACAPLLLPASTRLSFRNQHHDASAVGRQSAVYGVAYDPAQLALSRQLINWDEYIRGVGEFHSEISDYVVTTCSATAATYGSYVTVNINGAATADNDYLVTGLVSDPNATTASHKIVEVATGTAGNEITQARIASPGALTGFVQSMVHHNFRIPFIIFKGETVRLRHKEHVATARDAEHVLQLERINKI